MSNEVNELDEDTTDFWRAVIIEFPKGMTEVQWVQMIVRVSRESKDSNETVVDDAMAFRNLMGFLPYD